MALTEEKLSQKRTALIQRTATALHVSEEEAAQLLTVERRQSIRLNSLKAPVSTTRQTLKALCTTSPVPWMEDGLFVDRGLLSVRDSSLSTDGLVYIQNAASWLPVVALSPQPGESILDMCAAPGGKTSHIAQYAHNAALITANDNSRPRLHKLQTNMERLGAKNVTYTLHDAARLSTYLSGQQFDKILLDAPCSGEGMMTLEDKKAFESWSVAHIKRLQTLQKKLIVQAWRMLKPGGTLIYSTCTMAPEENEAVIDYLLRHNQDATIEPLTALKDHLDNCVETVASWNGKSFDPRIEGAIRLIPSQHLEAFFVAKLTKSRQTTAIL